MTTPDTVPTPILEPDLQTAPLGIYKVTPTSHVAPDRVYNVCTNELDPGPFELLALVRTEREVPSGIAWHYLRDDGLTVLFQWAKA